MLGTNRKSAAYAAEIGAGYVFGQFMSDVDGEEVLAAYRDAFIPSPLSPAPQTIVAVGVICAETEEDAEQLAATGSMTAFRQEGSGDEPASSLASSRKWLVGTPHNIASRLKQLSLLYGVDEFIVVTMIKDYKKRLQSYALLAEAVFSST